VSPSKAGKDVSVRRWAQVGLVEVMPGTLEWPVEALEGSLA
jgi:hypothetical protein